MSRMSFIAVSIFLFCSLTLVAQKKGDKKEDKKADLVWYTDVTQAQELSNKAHKPIFAFFTGSDWCGWCHKLENEVFAKPEFISWAKKNVILLELDFPRRKQLPPALMQQNAGLQQAFGVSGYPTIWLFYLAKDAAQNKFNISALGSLGYPEGAEPGKEELKFLSNANTVLANDTTGKKKKRKS